MLVLQLLLETEAHPTDEGEGPGAQHGRHPARAAGESTQRHPQSRDTEMEEIFSFLASDGGS